MKFIFGIIFVVCMFVVGCTSEQKQTPTETTPVDSTLVDSTLVDSLK